MKSVATMNRPSGYFRFVVGFALALGMAVAQSSSVDTPSPAEQKQLLARIGQYTQDYVSNLPNFLCVQTTRHFEAGRNSDKWHKDSVLTSRLTFTQGEERRTLETVNGKPVKPGMRPPRSPLVTEGEFGKLMANLFTEATDASFTWNRWDAIRGKRVVVFDYAVAKEHSTLSLSLSYYVKATLPYHGSIYAEPETGAVWRIDDSPTDFPPELKTQSVSTEIDYDQAAIAGKTYLLPARAVVTTAVSTGKMRNEMEFQDYRKFETESTITFQPDDSAKPAPAPPKPE